MATFSQVIFEMPDLDQLRHPSSSPIYVPDENQGSDGYGLPQYLANLESGGIIQALIPIDSSGLPWQSQDSNSQEGTSSKKSARKSSPNPQHSERSFSPEGSMVPSTPGADSKKHKVSERRAEQNRQAQKTFREKKLKYVKDLEEQLEKATQESRASELLKQENSDLRNVIASLQSENKKLRAEKKQLLNFTWNGTVPTFEPTPLPKSDFTFNTAAPTQLSSQAKRSVEGHSHKEPTEQATIHRETSKASEAFSPSASAASSHVSSSLSPLSSNTCSPVPHLSPLPDLDPASGSGEHFDTSLPQFSQIQPSLSSDTLPSNWVPLSPAQFDWEIESLLVGVPDQPAPHKRNLEEASFYNATPIPFIPVAFSKDEEANKDDTETEICELFKKIHCKDKNPENCHATKFVKKAI